MTDTTGTNSTEQVENKEVKSLFPSSSKIEEKLMATRVYDMITLEGDDEDDEQHEIDQDLHNEFRDHLHGYMKNVMDKLLKEKKEDRTEESKTVLKHITNITKFVGSKTNSDKELIKHLRKEINQHTFSYWRDWIDEMDKLIDKYKAEI
jgi:hypothetical protein